MVVIGRAVVATRIVGAAVTGAIVATAVLGEATVGGFVGDTATVFATARHGSEMLCVFHRVSLSLGAELKRLREVGP